MNKINFRILIGLLYLSQLTCLILTVYSFVQYFILDDFNWVFMGLFLLTSSYYCYHLQIGFKKQLLIEVRDSVKDILSALPMFNRRKILRERIIFEVTEKLGSFRRGNKTKK